MSRGPLLGTAAAMTAIFVTLSPSTLWAQTSAIAGVVKDATGAILPGVTVEAPAPR